MNGMMKFAKSLVLMLFGLAAMAGTIFIENRYEAVAESVFQKQIMVYPGETGATLLRKGEGFILDRPFELEPGDEIVTENLEVVLINYDDNGVIRVSPNSSFVFTNEFSDGYLFRIKNGRIWVNNLFTSSHTNIIAGAALLIPNKASIDVAFNGVEANIAIFGGQGVAGLIDPAFEPSEIVKINNPGLINSFLLSQGSKADISVKKVSENIDVFKKLLYSKLVKEFKLALFARARYLEDPWKSNVELDKELKKSVAENRYKIIRDRNLKYQSLESFSFTIDKLLQKSADYFTFSDRRKKDRLLEAMFDQLYDAEYLLIFGRITEANERIKLFGEAINENIGQFGDEFKTKILNRLRRMYSDLNFVGYTDELFPAKEAISDLLIANLGHTEDEIMEKDSYVRDYINQVYELVETNDLQARLVFDRYSQKIADLIKNEKTYLKDVKYLLSQENQILDNLFKQYYQFYQDKYFGIKKTIEDEWLKILDSGTNKDEEKQTIISTKIDFLKQLQTYFLDESVLLNDARKIALRLINEIRDLELETSTGISELFALRLQDYGAFLRFLKITDVGSLRGITPKDAYQNFLDKQIEQISIEQAIKEFLGEESEVAVPTVTTSEILEKIRGDFISMNVKGLVLGEFKDVNQKSIDITRGELNEVVFKAKYDWSAKSLIDIYSGSDLISDEPVRISGLSLLLEQYRKQLERDKELEKEVDNEAPVVKDLSQAERIALILLGKKLKSEGILADTENIEIQDVKEQTYIIRNAFPEINTVVNLSFVYDNKKDRASLLTIIVEGKNVRFEGEYKLSKIASVAVDAYETAMDEISVTEE